MKLALPMQRLTLLAALTISTVTYGLQEAAAAPAKAAGQGDQAAQAGPREKVGDWQIICQSIPTAQQQPGLPKRFCEITQQSIDKQANKPLAQVELVSIQGSVRANVMVPLGVALARGLVLKVDGGTASPATPFITCMPSGCSAPLELDQKKVDELSKGKKLNITMTSLQGQAITAPFSLNGFQKALQRSVELTNS